MNAWDGMERLKRQLRTISRREMDPCKFKSRCCIEARKRVVMGHHTHATFSDSKAWPVRMYDGARYT